MFVVNPLVPRVCRQGRKINCKKANNSDFVQYWFDSLHYKYKKLVLNFSRSLRDSGCEAWSPVLVWH